MMNIMWPRYLIQARSYISSNSNVRFLLIVSTKMYRNASVKEENRICIRGTGDCLRNKMISNKEALLH